MTSSVDLSPPRRPIFFRVVIATVFLTIIAMSAGFVLGERHRRAVQAGPTGGPTAAPTAAATGQQQTQPPTTRPATGVSCPPETRATAAGLGFRDDLQQVMKIRTANGTTVWICQDGGGRLYYQGKTGGVDTPLVEGTNGLFLSRVNQLGVGVYQAYADNGNRFDVSRVRLEVHFTSGRVQTSEVVAAE